MPILHAFKLPVAPAPFKRTQSSELARLVPAQAKAKLIVAVWPMGSAKTFIRRRDVCERTFVKTGAFHRTIGVNSVRPGTLDRITAWGQHTFGR
ncbi:hypothetical protein PUN4_1800003 [Paraburkholderia unamae]|nr:hypothetical protein PUN4_1800003 [Paraburkholderia unamae]